MREQGGSHRAIWLRETGFIEFFSQEITLSATMNTFVADEMKSETCYVLVQY